MLWAFAYAALISMAILGLMQSKSASDKMKKRSDSLSDDEFLKSWNDTYQKNCPSSAKQARKRLTIEWVTWAIIVSLLIVGFGGKLVLWILETMGI